MSDLTDLKRYQRALEVAERNNVGNTRPGKALMLAFESGIETDYLEHRRVESLPLMRFGLMLAAVFYLSFFAVDLIFWQTYQRAWTIIPILYISTTVNLLLFGLTYVASLRPALPWLAAATVLVNAFSFSFASAYGYKMGVPIPAEAPVIQQVYTLFLLNLSFRFAAPVAVITVSAFVLLHAMAGLEDSAFFYRSFMVTAAALVGVLACYITERNQRLGWLRARLLRELSEHDSLTGLYNHRIFYQRGDQLLRQARRDRCGTAVLVCDVDHFKTFNDSHGHLAGDEALRHIATALSKSARRPLDLAARLGGEEFALLLYNVTPEAAAIRAQEVRNVVRGLSLSEGRRVTISIGVAHVVAERVSSIEALVGAADSALYRAKAEGRDRVVM